MVLYVLVQSLDAELKPKANSLHVSANQVQKLKR
jgi:hypothetical protein